MIYQLLRQYDERECQWGGYPWPWAHGTTSGSGSSKDPIHSYMAIKDLIRKLSDYRCLRCGHPYLAGHSDISEGGEWSPCDEGCRHLGPGRWTTRDDIVVTAALPDFPGTTLMLGDTDKEKGVVKVEAQWRILTVHHLDEDKGNCRWWNLAALCQRCHLRMQRAVVMGRPYHFEHSEWFKPYAAGFYAFKYFGEDLTREETMDRLDELLALEHRFTQEAIF